ncbi:hypothetical protein TB2_038425 [Malus domestica]
MSGVASENQDKDEDVDRDGEHDVLHRIFDLPEVTNRPTEADGFCWPDLTADQAVMHTGEYLPLHLQIPIRLFSVREINKAKFNKLSSLTSRESSFGALVQKLVLVINIFKL